MHNTSCHLRHAGIVSDYNHSPTTLVKLREQLQNAVATGRIQVARRLICENQWRIVDQRPGDGDTLLLTTGEFYRAV